MPTRVGIELSPAACRIVELDARGSRRPAPDTRVRFWAVLPPGSPETAERFARFSRCDAAVVVWGARSIHHQVFVPARRYDQMRDDALALARDAGADTAGMLTDIAPSGMPQKGNRPVLLAMAAADDLSLAVQPIIDAGVRVRTVTTPAGALVALARLRRDDSSVAGAVEAYVALDERVTAVALVRDGALVAARELRWGYLGDAAAAVESDSGPLARDAIAARLIDEIHQLLSAMGAALKSLGQVVICGGFPELRGMALVMTERLDVEVEPLDSLFAIDSTRLPESSDDIRDRVAELRLAWAVAADWPTAINLLRQRQRQVVKTRLARVAVVAGLGVGLGAGLLAERGGWFQSIRRSSRPAPAPVAATRAVPPEPTPPPVAAARPDPVTPTPPPAVEARPVPASPTPPPAAVTRPAPAPAPSPLVASRAEPPVPAPPAVARVPPTQPTSTPPPLPPAAARSAPPATAPPAPPPASAPRAATATRPAATVEPSLTPPRKAPIPTEARPRPPAAPTPFNAVLGSILYSADRRLAIIDGRIVGVGEEVQGARVVDITPRTVTLRDQQGQLRTLTMAATAP